MKRHSLLAVIMIGLMAVSCGSEEPAATTGVAATESAVVTKTYDLTGIIVGRSSEASTLRIDHEDIGDWMGAMTMTFPVRDADFATLPADGAAITAKVHVSEEGDYWITDVVEAAAETEMEMSEEPAAEEMPAEEATAEEGEEMSL